jgi:hypothetical protein
VAVRWVQFPLSLFCDFYLNWKFEFLGSSAPFRRWRHEPSLASGETSCPVHHQHVFRLPSALVRCMRYKGVRVKHATQKQAHRLSS